MNLELPRNRYGFRLLKYLSQALLAIVILLGGFADNQVRADPGRPLSFGVLPVIQALPIFVAQEMGLFYGEGVEVEIIPFQTAMEKDVALTTGKIDGYFGDLFTPIVLKAGKVDVKIVARNFISGQGRRMFAVLAGPDSGLKIPVELADVPVAVSANTIIEYVTTSLIYRAGVPAEKISLLDVKNIPIRYQMLLSGQVKAATLPEPLVTLAETKGCRVLDDDGRSELSSTVLVFSGKTIRERSREITAFLAAISNAIEIINSGHADIRDIMNRNCRVPEPLKDTYPLPEFPELTLPEADRVEAAVSWLAARGTIRTTPKYPELVDGRFLE